MGVELLYLNGVVLPLSEGRINVEDRGFQLGDGVYEVVKILNGHAIWLEEHLERLEGSLAAIRLAGALSGHQLEEVIPDLAERSSVTNGMVYVQVTRGVEPRDFQLPQAPQPTVVAYARSVSGPSAKAIMAGEVLHPVEDRRWDYCHIKAIDLLAAVLAKDEARSAGANEAVFVAADGTVREGGSCNIFAFLNGTLRTHPADHHILDGITRRHILQVAGEAGHAVEERAFTLSNVALDTYADCEVFLASTLKDIMPVVRIGSHAIGGGRPGKVTLALLDRFRLLQAGLAGLEPPAAFSSQG
jgi:D-alanine transaminase